MRRIASEAYAYLAGHLFLTESLLSCIIGKQTDNIIINKQHAAAEINRLTGANKR